MSQDGIVVVFLGGAVQPNGFRHVTLSVCQSKCRAKGLIMHPNLVKSVYVGFFMVIYVNFNPLVMLRNSSSVSKDADH